jgi:aspartyl-tRNA(Asn)/glutamyl-tRNA(Gln) amidotransferase subunit B
MKTYTPTIGLEIHAELKTKTKMFCDSKNDPDEVRPNVNVCPICLGHPGTLPVINKEAVKHVLKMGLAVGANLADFTEFDRKNYFYPDIPKGYQISQYKYPLVAGGELAGVKITRVHLEEDTGTSKHDQGDFSLVDYNRAGVPLMELVTEPVIHSAEGAVAFAKELQLVMRTLGIAEANMEKGEMRVEANISVSPDEKFGTKVEVKNLNSFRAVEKAIEFEVARHIKALEAGEKIVQETRGWDEKAEKTFSQRQKEDSHDYRYFPDPDLPKLKISEIPEFAVDILKKKIPELPDARRLRYTNDFELRPEEVEMYVSTPWGTYFESIAHTVSIDGNKKRIKLASNYISSDLVGLVKKNPDVWEKQQIAPENLALLVVMIDENKVSSRGAKDILAHMYTDGGNPEEIAEKKCLIQKNDEAHLTEIVQKIISQNEKAVAEYKAGKAASLQFLIGQAMKETKGSANPGLLKDLFTKLL